MSEELMQVVPTSVGRFLYYPTRNSSLSQLRKANIITASVEKSLTKKRPDGLIIVPGGPVMAVIEYKQPQFLKTTRQIKKAIAQELQAARALCKVLIVTDNKKSFWVNTQNGHFILDTTGNPVRTIFNIKHFQNKTITTESVINFETTLTNIDLSISAKNDIITPYSLVDPTPLAKSLWQRIWITTGKEPEKCLYNVVELFLFKFLSDLGVLQNHLNFNAILMTRKSSVEDALIQYASISRNEIRKLFPASIDDGTTLINGTIFVNEKGEANIAQASLFGDVLDILDEFCRKHGSFRYIQREFKTRLYEAFLRQSAGVKALGQYFTPRNVVRAMVSMSPAASLAEDARICDPYCGVGGFVLETIVEVPKIFRQFEPRNGKVSPSITILGYDKGSDEKDDERTIILAKANMLIYFSDLIAEHHSANVLKEFSKNAFNKIFRLLRTNLGTFSQNNEKPFDLILTNPPYVTNGVSTIRKAIDEAGLSEHYICAGRGTEALAIEWIVRNLAIGGQALVVVPDGLLSQKGVIKFISDSCIVNAVVSLPSRTFYSTPKKTFILIITKKHSESEIQKMPVFAYLVSEIGESRDSYRFPIERNDLNEVVSLFNQFKGSPSTFKTASARCKLIDASGFIRSKNWLVDRLWSYKEKRELEITEIVAEVSGKEFVALAKDVKDTIRKLAAIPDTMGQPSKVKDVSLGDDWMEYISTKTGWTKSKYLKLKTTDTDRCPVFSAAKAPVVFVKPTYTGKIDASEKAPVISFGANGDGSAGTNFVFHTSPFYVSSDRTCIRIKNADIDPEYVFFALHGMKEAYGYNHAFKATKENLSVVSITIPISDKKFDLNLQRKMVKKFKAIYNAKKTLEAQLELLTKSRLSFV